MVNPFTKISGWFGRNGPDAQRMDQNGWAAEWMTFGGNGYPLGLMGSVDPDSAHEGIGNSYIEYVTGAYKASGIVFAACAARMMVFTEARFQYQRMANGRPGDLFGRPSLKLLETPWPNGTTSDLLARALQDVDLAGNHYVVTEGSGQDRRLRWLRPDWVDIVLTAAPADTSRVDVMGYVYKPGGTMDPSKWELFPIDGSNGTVAHWAPYPDPEAQYRGMSWMQTVMNDIAADKSMSRHKNKYFDHAAVPNLAISFKDTVTPAQFKDFVAAVRRTHGGTENAYKTLVLGGGADVKAIGSGMVDYTNLNEQGEHRICIAARVPPMIVGIGGTALQRTPYNVSNMQAAKNLFCDGTMRPLWRGLANSYAVLVPELRNARLWYDDRDIAFLRQDRQEIAGIQSTEAATLSTYIAAGFTPQSAILALKHRDLDLLEHTGLYSVQLQEPGSGNLPTPVNGSGADANTPDSQGAPHDPNDTLPSEDEE